MTRDPEIVCQLLTALMARHLGETPEALMPAAVAAHDALAKACGYAPPAEAQESAHPVDVAFEDQGAPKA